MRAHCARNKKRFCSGRLSHVYLAVNAAQNFFPVPARKAAIFYSRVEAMPRLVPMNVCVIKEIFFSWLFFLAIKTEKDYYSRFRTSDEQISPIPSPLFRAMCSFFFRSMD